MSQPERPDLEGLRRKYRGPVPPDSEIVALCDHALHVERERDEAREELETFKAVHQRVLSWGDIDVARAKATIAQGAAALSRKGGNGKSVIDALDDLQKAYSQDRNKVDETRESLTALRRRVREVISAVNGSRCGILRCYVCKWSKGHAPACPLAALLAECAE